MKTSDIPERPILEFLAKHQGEWCNWFSLASVGLDGYSRSVISAMPKGVPDKLALSKMKALVRKGLVNGCTCGCRGDFEITDAGLAEVSAPHTQAMICPTTDAERQKFISDFAKRHA